MDIASNEVLAVLNYLLPGLVATWSFRRLTPHDKPKDLEAIIEALLFTAAVQPLVLLVEWIAIGIGKHCGALGDWTANTAFVWAVMLGLIAGLASGIASNKDWIHSGLRRLGLTKQTAFPSEWYRHLFCSERHVILNLRDGRRIMGWPSEYPNSPEKGHFCLTEAAWLTDDPNPLELLTTEGILIPASEVLFLEFMKNEGELTDEQANAACTS